jgi:hypothetical protein
MLLHGPTIVIGGFSMFWSKRGGVKSWLAALCVALLGFLCLEPAHATELGVAHAAAPCETTFAYGIHSHDQTSAAEAPDRDQGPSRRGEAPHAHHCVAAHAFFLSGDGASLRLNENSLDSGIVSENSAFASNSGAKLERPPKAFAWV